MSLFIYGLQTPNILRDTLREHQNYKAGDPMNHEGKEELNVRLKLVTLEVANYFGVTKACREFNVPRSTFHNSKNRTTLEGVT